MMEKPSTEDSRKTDAKTTARRPRPNPWMFLLLGAAMLLLYMFTQLPRYSHIEDYGYFLELIRQGKVQRIEISEEEAYGIFADPLPLESELDSYGKPREERKPLMKNFHVRLLKD